MPSGVPSSSFLAYRLPIDVDDASTLLEILSRRSRAASFFTAGWSDGLLERGTMSTLVGATEMGMERT